MIPAFVCEDTQQTTIDLTVYLSHDGHRSLTKCNHDETDIGTYVEHYPYRRGKSDDVEGLIRKGCRITCPTLVWTGLRKEKGGWRGVVNTAFFLPDEDLNEEEWSIHQVVVPLHRLGGLAYWSTKEALREVFGIKFEH